MTIKNEPYVDQLISIQQEKKRKSKLVKPTDLRMKMQYRKKREKLKKSTILAADEIKTEPIDNDFPTSTIPSSLKPLTVPVKKSEQLIENDLMNFVIKKKSPKSHCIEMFPRLSNSQAETKIKSNKESSPTKKITAKKVTKIQRDNIKSVPESSKTLTLISVKPDPKSTKTLAASVKPVPDKSLKTSSVNIIKPGPKSSKPGPKSSKPGLKSSKLLKTITKPGPKCSKTIKNDSKCESKSLNTIANFAEPDLKSLKTKTDKSVESAPKPAKSIEEDEDHLLDEEGNESFTTDLVDEDALLNDVESEGKLLKSNFFMHIIISKRLS